MSFPVEKVHYVSSTMDENRLLTRHVILKILVHKEDSTSTHKEETLAYIQIIHSWVALAPF